jgi:hypothetical protein
MPCTNLIDRNGVDADASVSYCCPAFRELSGTMKLCPTILVLVNAMYPKRNGVFTSSQRFGRGGVPEQIGDANGGQKNCPPDCPY